MSDDIKELKDKIDHLTHVMDLLVSDSSMPIIRTIHENNISSEQLDRIHDVMEKMENDIDNQVSISKNEMLDRLCKLDFIRDSEKPSFLAHEIIMNMGMSDRWTKAYRFYVL